MNPRVLIIDDEVPILNGIKLNLGRTFDLTLANGGEEALKAVEEEEPEEGVGRWQEGKEECRRWQPEQQSFGKGGRRASGCPGRRHRRWASRHRHPRPRP